MAQNLTNRCHTPTSPLLTKRPFQSGANWALARMSYLMALSNGRCILLNQADALPPLWNGLHNLIKSSDGVPISYRCFESMKLCTRKTGRHLPPQPHDTDNTASFLFIRMAIRVVISDILLTLSTIF